MKLVLDANAGVYFSIKSSDSEVMEKMELFRNASVVYSPELFCIEVSNVYFKYYKGGIFSKDFCFDLLEQTIQMVDEFVPLHALYEEAFSNACNEKHPVYDFAYLILAKRYAAKLVTFDKKLITLAKKNHVEVL